MSNKVIQMLFLVLAFVCGCLATYMVTTKNQLDTGANHVNSLGDRNDSLSSSTSTYGSENDLLLNDSVTSHKKKDTSENEYVNNLVIKGVNRNDYTYDQALELIDNMPNLMLENHLDKFMSSDSVSEITDKRRFAERAVEELYQSNDNKLLEGDIKLSLDRSMPLQSVDTSTLNKFATVYAHLDTNGHTPTSPFVFIKWVNNQTGQIMLFEKKDIIPNTDHNWVSYKPEEGWQPGSYDVKFYQFSSELQPIAQLTYEVYTINDESVGKEQVMSQSTAIMKRAN